MQILLVEDEHKLAKVIQKGLQEEYYSVDVAYDGEEALEKFFINEYDLVVLDLMIPKIDGVTVCGKIREKNKIVPILILTAKDDTDTKVTTFDIGADDYVVKPFSFAELYARIRALIRRGNKADSIILQIADLSFDPATKVVKRGQTQINLTAREYALLEYFMRHPNVVLTKSQLLDHVWDYNYQGFSNIVETYAKYLRKKLKISPDSKELIHTIRGLGYVMKG